MIAIFLLLLSVSQPTARDLAYVARLLEEGEADLALTELERMQAAGSGSEWEDYRTLLKGEALRLSGRPESAEAAYERLLGEFPNSTWADVAGLRMTERLLAEGAIDEASGIAMETDAGSDSGRKARIFLASAYRSRGMPETAVRVLSGTSTIPTAGKPTPELAVALSEALLEAGRPKEAYPLVSAIALDGSPEALAGTAARLYALGLHGAGEHQRLVREADRYGRFLTGVEDRRRLRILLADVGIRMGDLAKSLESIRAVLAEAREDLPESGPEVADLALLLARAEIVRGSPESMAAAAAELERIVGDLKAAESEASPDQREAFRRFGAEVLNVLGEIYFRTGFQSQAAGVYEILSRRPDGFWPMVGRLNRGCALREGGRTGEALALFEEIYAEGNRPPGWEAAALAAADIYIEEGHWGNVLVALADVPREATAVSEPPVGLLRQWRREELVLQTAWRRAMAHLKMGENASARREAWLILETSRGKPELAPMALTNLAEIDLAAQDPGSAAARFEKALEGFGLLAPPASIPTHLTSEQRRVVEKALFGLGRALRKMGNFERAAAVFVSAGDLFPERRDGFLFERAGALAAAGKTVEAASAYREVVAAATPGEKALRSIHALLDLQGRRGEWTETTEGLRRLNRHLASLAGATETKPWARDLHDQVAYDYGRSLLATGANLEAVEAFREHLDRFPESRFSPRSRFHLGRAAYGAGRFVEATEAFEEFAALYPDSEWTPDAYLNLGWSFERRGFFDQAAEAWRKVREEFPLSAAAPAASSALAQKEESGDILSGAKRWRELAAAYPDSPVAPSALLRAGLLYLESIQPATAVLCLSRFREMFPDHPDRIETYYWEGRARELLGENDTALAAYDAFLAAATETLPPSARSLRADGVVGKVRCLNRREDPTRAIAFLQSTIDENRLDRSQAPRMQAFLGDLLFERGRIEEAVGIYRGLIRESRGDRREAGAQLRLARCLERLGRVDEALSAYLKTAYLYPSHGDIRAEAEFEAGRIFESRGLYREALRRYREAAGQGAGEDVRARAEERTAWLTKNLDLLEIELEKSVAPTQTSE